MSEHVPELNDVEIFPDGVRQVTCRDCLQDAKNSLGFEFSMAFQPIVDIDQGGVYAYEALVRGPNGEGAGSVLSQVNDRNRYYFDQAARITAIRLAAELDIETRLSINFMPNAVYKPQACIRATMEAAEIYGIDPHKLIFEVTEAEEIVDRNHLKSIFDEYRERGLLRAIDDYGEGFAGLNHLIELEPDVVKIDLNLVRGIDTDRSRQAVVRSTAVMCEEMDIRLIAEGVETRAEYETLREYGVQLFQGYWFARPAFESLPDPHLP
ncbi:MULTISPECIES: EAL domain-containing protein [unclassified Guyparkeria]|uniref:EAL domain-containing protein n=1 Tax=unclassified Guyparkeria TaxID=2626246 RepID=UPI000733423D|nr:MULTISPECIES: EAL domain-containing protein [unclassified Guyparkeria]KTG16698.1 diguanylate phosphodiesterase [Guyparkeria sp. XI15]OAE85732.1 diguanylate phosphodiesterase [Guyparkeria sp. WRN-7]